MKPIRLADAIAEVPAGTEPAGTPFEHKVKWHSYWEILLDVQEGRVVTPADEALASIDPLKGNGKRGGVKVCMFCDSSSTIFERGTPHVHEVGCVWDRSKAKVAALEKHA